MKKYTTIKDLARFKLSKVHNTKTGSKYYSIILYHNNWKNPVEMTDQVIEYMGQKKGAKDPRKAYAWIDRGREWTFSNRKEAEKIFNWVALRWS